jgi:mannan endo-1,4-beta-mannosidase
MIGQIAGEKKKLFALAETGFEAIPYEKWWTETLLKAIGDNKISYVLLWRNHGYQESTKRMHYYAPYKGQISEKDFLKFYNLEITQFEKQVAKANLYK